MRPALKPALRRRNRGKTVDFVVLRGKVTAHPGGEGKGLVEVAAGGYDQEQDRLYARAAQSVSGMYWLPEVEDVVEVAVPNCPGYEAHILRVHRPAGDDQTEQCWTEQNDIKQFRTRSGHTVTLDDAQDRTSIVIQSAGGLECRLEDEPQTVIIGTAEGETPVLRLDMKNDEITLSAGKKLTIQCGGACLEIDSEGNISLAAKGKLELSGREIALSAQSKLAAAGQQVEVSGGMTAKVEGKTQLQLASSGVTEVKGGVIKLN